MLAPGHSIVELCVPLTHVIMIIIRVTMKLYGLVWEPADAFDRLVL